MGCKQDQSECTILSRLFAHQVMYPKFCQFPGPVHSYSLSGVVLLLLSPTLMLPLLSALRQMSLSSVDIDQFLSASVIMRDLCLKKVV